MLVAWRTADGCYTWRTRKENNQSRKRVQFLPFNPEIRCLAQLPAAKSPVNDCVGSGQMSSLEGNNPYKAQIAKSNILGRKAQRGYASFFQKSRGKVEPGGTAIHGTGHLVDMRGTGPA